MKEDKIILYTTDCPRCKLLERHLDEKKIPYEKSDDIELLLENGFRTVPVLCVNNEFLDFPKALNWVKNH